MGVPSVGLLDGLMKAMRKEALRILEVTEAPYDSRQSLLVRVMSLS